MPDNVLEVHNTAIRLRRMDIPHTTVRSCSVQWLNEQVHSSTIDLQANYQRGIRFVINGLSAHSYTLLPDVVWPITKKMTFLNSLFNNIPSSPLIFSVTKTTDGDLYHCIDGKQRLSTIHQFLDGLIPYKDKDSTSGLEYWYRRPSSQAHKLKLPQEICDLFLGHEILCVVYDSLSEGLGMQMFKRSQMGVSLSPAERMMATSGGYSNLTRQVQCTINSQDGLGHNLEWNVPRGSEYQAIAQLVYLISKGEEDMLSEPTQRRVEAWLNNPDHQTASPEVILSVTHAVDILLQLARHSELSVCLKIKKLSPFELAMIVYIIHVAHRKLNLTELSYAIRTIRTDVLANCGNNVIFDTVLLKQVRVRIKRLSSLGSAHMHANGDNQHHASSSMPSIRRTSVVDDDMEGTGDPNSLHTKFLKGEPLVVAPYSDDSDYCEILYSPDHSSDEEYVAPVTSSKKRHASHSSPARAKKKFVRFADPLTMPAVSDIYSKGFIGGAPHPRSPLLPPFRTKHIAHPSDSPSLTARTCPLDSAIPLDNPILTTREVLSESPTLTARAVPSDSPTLTARALPSSSSGDQSQNVRSPHAVYRSTNQILAAVVDAFTQPHYGENEGGAALPETAAEFDHLFAPHEAKMKSFLEKVESGALIKWGWHPSMTIVKDSDPNPWLGLVQE